MNGILVPEEGITITLIVTKEGWKWQSWNNGNLTGSFNMKANGQGAIGDKKGSIEDHLLPEEVASSVDDADSGILDICYRIRNME